MSNYPNTSNPFFGDDDDDFGFAKPRPGASRAREGDDWDDVPEFGQPVSRPPPLTREEQLQQMKENSKNRQLEGTQRALSSMYESERMGVATAEVRMELFRGPASGTATGTGTDSVTESLSQ